MNDATEYSDSIAADIAELNAALENDGGIDWIEELNALDFEYTANLDGHLRSVRVVRTLGGPNCFIDFDGHGEPVVTTYWGSKQGERHVHAPTLEEAVWELVSSIAKPIN